MIRLTVGVVIATLGLVAAVTVGPMTPAAGLILPLAMVAIASGAAIAAFAALDAMGEPR